MGSIEKRYFEVRIGREEKRIAENARHIAKSLESLAASLDNGFIDSGTSSYVAQQIGQLSRDTANLSGFAEAARALLPEDD